jgi:hypothetical protein
LRFSWQELTLLFFLQVSPGRLGLLGLLGLLSLLGLAFVELVQG